MLLGGHRSPEDGSGCLSKENLELQEEPQDARSPLLLELESSGVRGQAGDIRVQSLGW